MRIGETVEYKTYKIKKVTRSFYEIRSRAGTLLTWRATKRAAERYIDERIAK